MSQDDDWEAIKAMTPEEVDAELLASGMTPYEIATLGSRIAAKVCAAVGPKAAGSLQSLARQHPGWVRESGDA